MIIHEPFTFSQCYQLFRHLTPFGLYNIFNYLVCQGTEYDKQGSAVYRYYDGHRFFEEGYSNL